MSVSSYTDVWCDVCGNWEEEATSPNAKRARKIAAKHGWKVGLPGGLDMCPACAAKGEYPERHLGEEE